MALTEILAVVTHPEQESVLGAAEMLAARWKGRITVLFVEQLPDPVPGDAVYTGSLWAELLNIAREQFAKDREALRKRLDRMDVPVELREDEAILGGVEGLVAQHAMHADIAVLASSHESSLETAFQGALFRSGRPVLLVPADKTPATIGKRVLVAWKARREAARALADAEPFLREADSVTVVTVDAQPDGYGEGPGRDIATYLARKGLDVELRNIDGMGRPAETAIMNEARTLSADLIVMGGYGHSRMREFVFGGVTRALSRQTALPILMSH